MTLRLSIRQAACALSLLSVGFMGCGESVSPTPTSVVMTPSEVLDPEPGPVVAEPAEASAGVSAAPSEATPAVKVKEEAAKSGEPDEKAPEASLVPRDLGLLGAVASVGFVSVSDETDTAKAGVVELVPMSFDEYLSKAVKKPEAKLTIVDAWATWCGPCKENFPHLVEMHNKYASKGLNVVSLSMDDPSDAAAVKEAKAFLEKMDATFTNVLLKEDFGVGFERLNINAIPAVFLYGPDGKEMRRFTLDDTKNQFTYEEVDKVVDLLLKGEKLPADAPGQTPAGGK